MHGGTIEACQRPSSKLGLSPHARGNRVSDGRGKANNGSIPACTGEPTGLAVSLESLWVYPRMHGGTSSLNLEVLTTRGLSPHARGNRARVRRYGQEYGSIPACTGEPLVFVPCLYVLAVYPRMHGGTIFAGHLQRPNEGLSPHARGNLEVPVAPTLPTGSIPACTGEPTGEPVPKWSKGVYPRMHGGTRGRKRPSWLQGGLSPHARGNLVLVEGEKKAEGSIPACTGEPGPPVRRTRPVGVYPRMHGGTAARVA